MAARISLAILGGGIALGEQSVSCGESRRPGLPPGLSQTIIRAELYAALVAIADAWTVDLFTDVMYMVHGFRRIQRFHAGRPVQGSLRGRLKYAFKRVEKNHEPAGGPHQAPWVTPSECTRSLAFTV